MSMVSAFPMCNSSLGGLYASAQPTCRRQAHQLDTEEFIDSAADTKKISVSSTSSSLSSCSGTGGGLKRTVSSLQAVKQCILSNANASAKTSGCIVEARQVEIYLTTQSDRPFFLRVRAPNGECSERFAFPFGKTARFSPRLDGCGHGQWQFEIEPISAEGGESKDAQQPLIQRSISLDGVGSLYFTIDKDFNLRINEQMFLRLPSASQACQVHRAAAAN